MAGLETSGGNIEVFPWLKSLPVAPEYHPTLAEFQDPIAYIFKIEKEASKYGICKIVPPVLSPSKKTAIANLNESLLARSNDLNPAPTFTTRQQQIGFCPRKHKPVQKPVWQSGENYTVSEFEAMAKDFEKSYLKKYVKKGLNALEIETLYWKATVDKPFSVEYANDIPGSAFVVKKVGGKGNEGPLTVGETEWNMRGVSRSKCSLLRFMKEEIPGVTSPMVYIAMMFSWFAWHVEDHDLHSLNYMHFGAGKTWYGVPREVAVAFEEVIRVQGYGGEINPLVTFATLGKKTTVMSPEVLVNAGVPCCRLVQNAGEFVVTFPRAYHSGFSHGFNCGEAANIATPEWLRIAKDAAVRRASINCSPMVSHFQLMYDLALSLCSSLPKSICVEPQSSRLKDKKKSVGEMLIKELFSQDVMQNNNTLHILGKGSAVVVLPQNSLSSSNLQLGTLSATRSRLFSRFCRPDLELKTTKSTVCEDVVLDRKQEVTEVGGHPVKGKVYSLCNDHKFPSLAPQTGNANSDIKRAPQFGRLSEKGLFSCVTCGILCFACVAIVQPTEAAARYLMSADCSIFDDWEAAGNGYNPCTGDVKVRDMNPHSVAGSVLKRTPRGLFDVPISSAAQNGMLNDDRVIVVSNSKTQKDTSALGLLALMYDNSSDSEEEEVESYIPVKDPETEGSDCTEGEHDGKKLGYSQIDSGNEVPIKISNSYAKHGPARAENKVIACQSLDYSDEFKTDKCKLDPNSLSHSFRNLTKLQNSTLNCNPVAANMDEVIISTALVPFQKTTMSFPSRSDEEYSRMHVFCLQHAVQVEQRLSSFGGARIFLVIHPDYPKLESQAKKVAEELKIDHLWNDTPFREATEEDEEMIRLALDSEDATHGNGDWAVKLGINLYYSASLSRSPLYSKQMPYNAVVYNAFGRRSPADILDIDGKDSLKQKRFAVAGKWCGKVWMSSQVHPMLTNKDFNEQDRTWVELDVKFGRPLDATRTAEAASTSCKTCRKRKSRSGNRSAVKAKSLMAENQEESSEDSLIWNSLMHARNKLGNKRMKKETPESQNKGERNKKSFEALTEDEVEESPIRNSNKQQAKSKLGNKRTKKENPEPQSKRERSKKHFDSHTGEEVEEPSFGNSHEQLKSKLGRKRVKKDTPEPQTTRERTKKHIDRLSEDEVEESPIRNSPKQVKSKLENKKMKKATPEPQNTSENSKKRSDSLIESELEGWPGTRLRKRTSNLCKDSGLKSAKARPIPKMQHKDMITKKSQAMKVPSIGNNAKIRDEEMEYPCNMEGCSMSFGSKQELTLHKRNICPVKGCGKKFFSHKYLVQHRRVHMDDRPLKCPWKGCKMTFKWAWARTEHIRVHTGARPYVCTETGCGQTFRFVSDFSRHKRKTGHSSKKSKG